MTITGTNFGSLSSTTVRFGGTPAQLTSVDPSGNKIALLMPDIGAIDLAEGSATGSIEIDTLAGSARWPSSPDGGIFQSLGPGHPHELILKAQASLSPLITWAGVPQTPNASGDDNANNAVWMIDYTHDLLLTASAYFDRTLRARMRISSEAVFFFGEAFSPYLYDLRGGTDDLGIPLAPVLHQYALSQQGRTPDTELCVSGPLVTQDQMQALFDPTWLAFAFASPGAKWVAIPIDTQGVQLVQLTPRPLDDGGVDNCGITTFTIGTDGSPGAFPSTAYVPLTFTFASDELLIGTGKGPSAGRGFLFSIELDQNPPKLRLSDALVGGDAPALDGLTAPAIGVLPDGGQGGAYATSDYEIAFFTYAAGTPPQKSLDDRFQTASSPALLAYNSPDASTPLLYSVDQVGALLAIDPIDGDAIVGAAQIRNWSALLPLREGIGGGQHDLLLEENGRLTLFGPTLAPLSNRELGSGPSAAPALGIESEPANFGGVHDAGIGQRIFVATSLDTLQIDTSPLQPILVANQPVRLDGLAASSGGEVGWDSNQLFVRDPGAWDHAGTLADPIARGLISDDRKWIATITSVGDSSAPTLSMVSLIDGGTVVAPADLSFAHTRQHPAYLAWRGQTLYLAAAGVACPDGGTGLELVRMKPDSLEVDQCSSLNPIPPPARQATAVTGLWSSRALGGVLATATIPAVGNPDLEHSLLGTLWRDDGTQAAINLAEPLIFPLTLSADGRELVCRSPEYNGTPPGIDAVLLDLDASDGGARQLIKGPTRHIDLADTPREAVSAFDGSAYYVLLPGLDAVGLIE